MSNWWLCDRCRNQLPDAFSRCVKGDPSRRVHPKKIMHDGIRDPHDVCKDYEPRERDAS